MYNGYTETLERATDRLNARLLKHYEAMYGADWEQDATDVRMHLESLDICDWLVQARALRPPYPVQDAHDPTPPIVDMPDVDFSKIEEIEF